MPRSLPLLTLPDWMEQYCSNYQPDSSLEARMTFVIQAARLNIEHNGGGPFAAAIFERDSGALVSLGTNLVTSHNNAILHAEIVAIMLAQQACNTFDLGSKSPLAYDLISSSEPCAMCIGATNWSGIRRLVFGAAISDATAIGFDEGPVSPTWRSEMQNRGIEIVPDVLRSEAVDVLNSYQKSGGTLYNGRSS